MAGQNEKDTPQDRAKKGGDQQAEAQPEDVLELDTDDEMEDLVESIEEKERTMKTGKKE